jgi:hypothetical protein
MSSSGDGSTGEGTTTQGGSAGGPRLDIGDGADLGGSSLAVCDEVEEFATNQRCEFWAVDLPNVSRTTLDPAPHEQQFAVVVTNSVGEDSAPGGHPARG